MPEENRGRLGADRAFAAYGRVMAKIGAFEQFMRIAIGEHEIRRIQAAGKNAELPKFGRRMMRMDFGGLAQQICQRFKFDADLRSLMKEAKQFRNNLAHVYWTAHFSNLHTPRGIEIIVRECSLYETQFDRLSDTLIRATGMDAERYVAYIAENAHDEELHRDWEARLAAAQVVFDDTDPAKLASAHSSLAGNATSEGKEAPSHG